ncbi:MAG: ComEC/Rec2 family competence protein [Patescibacteria group bacterium]
MEIKKKYIVGFALVLLSLNFFCWKEVFSLTRNNYLKVNFLDVGQGDSAFIETPEKHQILIDGGPNSKVLEKLQNLMPFFDRTIDLVILTHPESDHMQGLMGVLQRYKVDYVLWTGVARNTSEYQKWVSILDKVKNPQKNFLASLSSKLTIVNFDARTEVIAGKAGTKIKAGNAEIDILYPFENLSGKELKNTSNDTCIVSKLIYGKSSFLFTGDISSKAEKKLSNAKADVLKIAHHGSKYSTSDIFLEAVKPKIAVISVGAKNTYGHPTPEVLQRLANYDIKVLRTDQQGDIKFISDGNNIYLK